MAFEEFVVFYSLQDYDTEYQLQEYDQYIEHVLSQMED